MASFLMIKLFFVIFSFTILYSYVLGLDPCRDYTSINNPYRSAKYKFDSKRAALCDWTLATGWYRFISIVGGTIPTTKPEPYMCGTVAPIWMKGTLPTTVGFIVNTTACVNDRNYNNGCYHTIPMSVTKCTGDYYVYFLRPAFGCSWAYCAGDKEPCPNNQSRIVPNCEVLNTTEAPTNSTEATTMPTTIVELKNTTTNEFMITTSKTVLSTTEDSEDLKGSTGPTTRGHDITTEELTTARTPLTDGKSETRKGGISLPIYAYVLVFAGFLAIIGLIVWFSWRKLHKKTKGIKKEVDEQGYENPDFNDNIISPKLDWEQEPVYESLDLQDEKVIDKSTQDDDLDLENGYQKLDEYQDLEYVTMVAEDGHVKDSDPQFIRCPQNTPDNDYQKLEKGHVPTYEKLVSAEPKEYYNSAFNPHNENSKQLDNKRKPAYLKMVSDEIEMKDTQPRVHLDNTIFKVDNNKEQAFEDMIPQESKINPEEPNVYYNNGANPETNLHDQSATQKPAYEKMAPQEFSPKEPEVYYNYTSKPKTKHHDLTQEPA